MPSIWALPPVGATIEDDGVLRLSNGRTFILADVPGRIGGKNWRNRAALAVQALMDKVLARADMPDDDADKTADAATLLVRYNERRILRDDDLVDSSTIFSWEVDSPNLIPIFRRAL